MGNRFNWLLYAAAAVLLVMTWRSTASAQNWKPVEGHIMTRWAKDVSPLNALPEYPRPQMVRTQWQSLNGLWDYALTDAHAAAPPSNFTHQILVPFPYESALSGVGEPSIPNQRLWYRRVFSVPEGWQGEHVLLHFGAVNWDAAVLVNGHAIGTHRGGYDGFTFDITSALQPGNNTLTVSAWNPLNVDVADAQVLGKQRLHPGGIFYTACTGIWQSVWMEPVPAVHISSLKIVPEIDSGVLHLTVNVEGGEGQSVSASVIDSSLAGRAVSSVLEHGKGEITLPMPHAHLWSPDDPHLYGLHVALLNGGKKSDAVDSYFAMRKVSVGKDDRGTMRILLNNHFVLQIGALDQGYWPDGIYTAPTDEALKSDILAAKGFGLNLLRKHAKVEPDRWYYWTDKLGMLVWQDMPQAFGRPKVDLDHSLTDAAKAQWLSEWKGIIADRFNHPSIIVWTTFNEAWGQHDTANIVAITKRLDPSRLVNSASGWEDKAVGDIRDTHAYPGPWCDPPKGGRASVNGEFGGLTMRVPGHMWTNDLFGYGATLRSGWKITEKYQKLLVTAHRLRDERGGSAFVYTQLTDVEQESNGLLTYDRAVVKPVADIVAAANQGRFLPLPPAPLSHELLATSEEDPQRWSYTIESPPDDWMQPGFDASGWKTGPAPFGQGYPVNTPWTQTPGDIWIRRSFTLAETIPANLVLSVIHDEDVEIFINGHLAASALGVVGHYIDLPMSPEARASLKPGENCIAAHCRQTTGGQVIDVGIVEAP